MKTLLNYLVKQLVDHPKEVKIEEKIEASRTILTIHADQSDLGKIIGRSGRIIRALRDLLKIVAAKHQTYVDVEIAEDAQKVSEAT